MLAVDGRAHAGLAGGGDIAGCAGDPAIGAGLAMGNRLTGDFRGALLGFAGCLSMRAGFAFQRITRLAGISDRRQFLWPKTVGSITVVRTRGEIIFITTDGIVRAGSVAITHITTARYLGVGTRCRSGCRIGAGKRIGVAGKYEVGAYAAEHDDKQDEQYAVEAQRDAA
jgi:hypothetical protein